MPDPHAPPERAANKRVFGVSVHILVAVLIAWVGLFVVAIGVGQGIGYFVGLGIGGIGCVLFLSDLLEASK